MRSRITCAPTSASRSRQPTRRCRACSPSWYGSAGSESSGCVAFMRRWWRRQGAEPMPHSAVDCSVSRNNRRVDQLKALQTFVGIADHGSLTKAAQAMDLSLPAVVRSLAALEAHLRVRLFNRTTRRVALTDEGRRYLEYARRILATLTEA